MPPVSTNTLAFKLGIILILIGMAWIPTMVVLVLTTDRANRANEAAREIASMWGQSQLINGPIITIPLSVVSIENGKQVAHEERLYLLPETLAYDVDMNTEKRSRGIFDAAVYTATVHATGTVHLSSLNSVQSSGTILWNKARLSVGIPDTRGVAASTTLMWNGAVIPFEPGVAGPDIGQTGISAPIALNPAKDDYTFSFDTSLRGSQRFDIAPVGKTTEVTMRANWASPSFTGSFLPDNREVSDSGFTATWSVSSFGRATPQAWMGAGQPAAALYSPPVTVLGGSEAGSFSGEVPVLAPSTMAAAFGVDLMQTVDLYTEVNRAVKYSILFIGLTFLAFFMFEVLSGLRIHPIHYLLVGLAIALFYLLLLSLAETIGFLSAYLISTIATTGLIASYSASVLKARGRASVIAGLLLALFAYLYILLQLEELSLLFGSIMLFASLSTVMYLTRAIDWYSFSGPRNPKV